ncbi:unnamed protein product [Heligmosomoides polygyrus]|uniref:Secreted protein n=1 Tax=Heligmosomoides polygyrus TaxID=6339 RepID=A0A183FBI2_HELPZ|nr:unnamed protein product [Heligmosomoides polygyrus]
MCGHVRQEMGTTSLAFSKPHPFSCWLSSMLMCFAGGHLACFLGEPASAVWYTVFYSPFDLVYKLACPKPVSRLLRCEGGSTSS